MFQFRCSLLFVDFLLFSIWFSVFVKNTSGFSVLVSDVVFGFSYFALFGFRFLFDLLRSHRTALIMLGHKLHIGTFKMKESQVELVGVRPRLNILIESPNCQVLVIK